MLTSVHFLLTYTCLYECEHCFLYCGPGASGTFTREHLAEGMRQGVELGISSVYFEGGEPFLHYPLLLEGLQLAKQHGLSAGVVSNGYWATSPEDAVLWLQPIAEIGIDDLSISNDRFHDDQPEVSHAANALAAARKLGIPVGAICIDPPRVSPVSHTAEDGAVIGGDVLFKGRAADALVANLPRRPLECFRDCPHEELAKPSRIHLDPFGNVFVCQGISIGNAWEQPLARIFADYVPESHPIVGPLLRGGPAELVRQHRLGEIESGVDHCEVCFSARRRLLDRFDDCLRPRQVYGC